MTVSRVESKRIFLMAPFRIKSDAEARDNVRAYDFAKQHFGKLARELRPIGGIGRIFSEAGIGGRTSFGTVLDLDKLSELASSTRDPSLMTFWQLTQAVDIRKEKASHEEALAVVKQLKELGHKVVIEEDSEPKSHSFFRDAVNAGAEPKAPERSSDRDRQTMKDLLHMQTGAAGFQWARDRHVKIDGIFEKPKMDIVSLMSGKQHFFGEGGMMVQVGPKEWAISQHVAKDPRVRQYEAKGHKFQHMPNGILYDQSLSDILGEPIYEVQPHVDFSIGAVPELKVVAVCPHYKSQNRLSITLMEGNLGVKVVEVPKEEAHRNPANFLPLGNGQALVDSGAPKFIELLRKAGVDVIPTAKPLNNLLIHKGGLHCLFNEL